MSSTVLADLAYRPDPRRGACALIAVKRRAHCKTRLAQVLTPLERVELVRSMLGAVLSAATAAQTVRRVIVLSPERDSVPDEIPVLADSGEGLNAALTQAHAMVRDFGCGELVILPADLPHISAMEIDELVRAARASAVSGGIAIAPDAAGLGTNALCLVSPRTFRFQFGADSKALHLEEARRMGLRASLLQRPGLEFDVDTPADLTLLDRQSWLARLRA